MRGFPSKVTALEEHYHPAWENLGNFTKPFLFLGGELDHNMGRMTNQIRLTTHIPEAKGQVHDRYKKASHFTQENSGFELGKKVVEFMKSNPLK